MKEVKRTVTIQREVIEYAAADGTLFSNKSECENYEKSAQCALIVLYNNMVINRSTEYELFGGDTDVRVDFVKVSDTAESNVILQLIALIDNISDSSEKSYQEYAQFIKEAIDKKDTLLIAWSCERDYVWIINTCSGLKDKLNHFSGNE